MRIAFIVGPFPVLSETFILNQITGLLDRGHEVDIFALARPPAGSVHPDFERYRLHERTCYVEATPDRVRRLAVAAQTAVRALRTRRLRPFRALNPLRFGRDALSLSQFTSFGPFIGRPEYDVIHSHFGPSGLFAQLLRSVDALRGPLITTFHGYDISSYLHERGHSIYAGLFRYGDAFTCSSLYIRNRLVAAGCDARKLVRFKLGTDLAKFPFRERRPTADGPLRILTVARLTEKKGFEYAIPAVAKILPAFPNVRYDIVGDGHLRGRLAQLIQELGAGASIRLLGWKNEAEVRQIFADSHLFLLASVEGPNGDVEGQGMVLQEAQAMGLPVICTRHNGFPESILDGRSGFLAPERDSDALAATLHHAISQPERWPELGRAGREYVEREYDLQERNDALVELYRSLQEAAPGRATERICLK
ncbi:MAG: glycosyltransferase [Verrucomicrobia bacterium]|nr:glycosyltransferase [Verrucomicrobiota bacterium]